MKEEESYESAWQNNPEVIKKFLEQKVDHEELCKEVAYILKKALLESNIEISTIHDRAKTLNSFLEKITRKNYSNPFNEITDFSGVRVVYLYQRDFEGIEKIIENEFSVMEKVDKLNDKGADKFGYGAVHYIVRLGKNSSGARYDSLKHCKCEIQVRTVLQDAWAIIDHHLVYKRESDIPTTLLRKLNSLAGLFETADDQFEAIRTKREEYITQLQTSINSQEFLKNELNLDTFTEYLKWKFPDKNIETFKGQLDSVFITVSKMEFKNIGELDMIVEKNKKYLPKIKKHFLVYNPDSVMHQETSASLAVFVLIGIESTEYADKVVAKQSTKDILKSFSKK